MTSKAVNLIRLDDNGITEDDSQAHKTSLADAAENCRVVVCKNNAVLQSTEQHNAKTTCMNREAETSPGLAAELYQP